MIAVVGLNGRSPHVLHIPEINRLGKLIATGAAPWEVTFLVFSDDLRYTAPPHLPTRALPPGIVRAISTRLPFPRRTGLRPEQVKRHVQGREPVPGHSGSGLSASLES